MLKALKNFKGLVFYFLITIFFLVLISWSLVNNYINNKRINETNKQLKEERIRSAVMTFEMYIDSRLEELNRVIRAKEISAYYENKALGMSLKYGLGSSLEQIKILFADVISNNQLDLKPVIKNITLIDDNKIQLVDNVKILITSNNTIGISDVDFKKLQLLRAKENEGELFYFNVPVILNEKYVSSILAEIDLELILNKFIGNNSEILPIKIKYLDKDIYSNLSRININNGYHKYVVSFKKVPLEFSWWLLVNDGSASNRLWILILFWLTVVGIAGVSLFIGLRNIKIIIDIGGVVKNLDYFSNQLQNISTKIGYVGRKILTNFEKQMSEIKSNVNKIDDVSASINNTNRFAAESQLITKKMNEQVSKSTLVMENFEASMNRIDKNCNSLKSIDDTIRDISGIVESINDVVFNIKIVSLNASLEAAKSGEHGRRFMVVAEEVARLANVGKNMSQKIENKIQTSKKQISEIIKEMSGAVSYGLETKTEVVSTFQKISDQINDINLHIQKIASASQAQLDGINQTFDKIKLLDNMAEENNKKFGVTLVDLKYLLRVSSSLKKISDELVKHI